MRTSHDVLDVQFFFRKSFQFGIMTFKVSANDLKVLITYGALSIPWCRGVVVSGVVGCGGDGDGDRRPGSSSNSGSGSVDENCFSEPSGEAVIVVVVVVVDDRRKKPKHGRSSNN